MTAQGAHAFQVLGDDRATENPCTLCAPLGAALVTAGLAEAIPLLHGAQGCATYIRRYLISHFREPVDIASSSFGESQTVFGGEANLHQALANIEKQYHPKLVTVATTCLAETIGEDVERLLQLYREKHGTDLPMVSVSTPSFKDGHVEGFHSTVRAIVDRLARENGPKHKGINLLPAILSPADLRHLRKIAAAYGLTPTVLPDYSQTLDGVVLDHYRSLPTGGTTLDAIAQMPRALGTVDFTLTGKALRASTLLAERGAPAKVLGLPMGVRATDAFCQLLQAWSGNPMPAWLEEERGRLLDAYADGHKYLFGKRVALFGDPELVAGLAIFLAEVGALPVVCATGARNRSLGPALAGLPEGAVEAVLEDTDYVAIEAACRIHKPDLLIGTSKGYGMSRTLDLPLIRVGFPIHDRLGAGRILHVGYKGTLRLFDEIVNTLLARKQDRSSTGFSYL